MAIDLGIDISVPDWKLPKDWRRWKSDKKGGKWESNGKREKKVKNEKTILDFSRTISD